MARPLRPRQVSRVTSSSEPVGSGRMLRWAFVWVVIVCAATAAGAALVRFGLPVLAGGPLTAHPLPPLSRPVPKPVGSRVPVANSLAYRADAQGHFFVDARVNGAAIRFLVDTGATIVALTQDDARAAGVLNGMLKYDLPVQTADGIAHAAPVTIREIALGQMTQEEIPAMVMEKQGAMSLLGMSFLGRLNYEVKDHQLILYW